jgi:uncharacterized protein YbjQ (UPF0145 family)
MDALIQLILVVMLLLLGFSMGGWHERAHLRSLARREQELADIQVRNVKVVPDADAVSETGLVMGEAVIATDYFKSFAAGLRNIVGGEVRTFEKLMGRARREATVRMLEKARAMGASEVWNVRLETSNIRSAGGRSKAVSVEVLAFGTAVKRT